MTLRFGFVKRFVKNFADCFHSPHRRKALLPATRSSMTSAAARVKGFVKHFGSLFFAALPATNLSGPCSIHAADWKP